MDDTCKARLILQKAALDKVLNRVREKKAKFEIRREVYAEVEADLQEVFDEIQAEELRLAESRDSGKDAGDKKTTRRKKK